MGLLVFIPLEAGNKLTSGVFSVTNMINKSGAHIYAPPVYFYRCIVCNPSLRNSYMSPDCSPAL